MAAKQAAPSTATTPEEEAIIRHRLLAKEQWLKNCTKSWLKICGSLEKGCTYEEAHKEYLNLLKILAQYEFSVGKANVVYQCNQLELADYTKLIAGIEEERLQTADQIEKLKLRLQEEKNTRRHREEYELLARKINELVSRQTLSKEIEQLQKEIEEEQEESRRIVTKMDLRGKQFHLFLHSLYDLEKALQEDEEPVVPKPPTIQPTQPEDATMADATS